MEEVQVAGYVRLTIGTWWLAIAGAACGSGNLGKIVQTEATTAPPEQADVTPAPPIQLVDAAVPRGVCGDGVIQALRGEQCDGIDFGGRNCTNLGLGNGFLYCDSQTCQIIANQCAQTGAALPAPDAGKPDSAVDAGMPDAGTSPKACPSGYYCQASVFQSGEFLCSTFGEETPPLCLDPASDTSCAMVLPGSVCTDTTIGAYCMLHCR